VYPLDAFVARVSKNCFVSVFKLGVTECSRLKSQA